MGHRDDFPRARSGLDIALGVGGFAEGGGWLKIYGPESSGKTTLALHTVAEGQKKGRYLRLHRRRTRARSGVRPKARRQYRRALISQPDTGEGKALGKSATPLVRSGAVDVLVIDFGRGHLVPKAELEGEDGPTRCPACRHGLMSQALRKLHRLDQQIQHHGDLHQPDPDEDRA